MQMSGWRLALRVLALIFMAAWLFYSGVRSGDMAEIVAPGVLLAVAFDDVRRDRKSPFHVPKDLREAAPPIRRTDCWPTPPTEPQHKREDA